jgi:hypothetical protein
MIQPSRVDLYLQCLGGGRTGLWLRRSFPHNAVRDVGFSGNARSCDFYIRIHIPLSIIDYYTIV